MLPNMTFGPEIGTTISMKKLIRRRRESLLKPHLQSKKTVIDTGKDEDEAGAKRDIRIVKEGDGKLGYFS